MTTALHIDLKIDLFLFKNRTPIIQKKQDVKEAFHIKRTFFWQFSMIKDVRGTLVTNPFHS